MNQNEFMRQLKVNLSGVSLADQQDILNDYLAHFHAGKKEGKTEEQIAEELGNPYEIAGMYKTEVALQQNSNQSKNNTNKASQTHTKGKNTPASILAIIALIVFNVMVMFPVICSVVGIVFGFFATAIGICVGGIAVFIAAFTAPFFAAAIHPAIVFIAMILLAVSLICLGILLFIGSIYVSKWIIKLMGMYVEFNKKLVKEAEAM